MVFRYCLQLIHVGLIKQNWVSYFQIYDRDISKSESKSTDKKAESKKEKKSAADRREELLKQLKAVENAIAKKRTKISN